MANPEKEVLSAPADQPETPTPLNLLAIQQEAGGQKDAQHKPVQVSDPDNNAYLDQGVGHRLALIDDPETAREDKETILSTDASMESKLKAASELKALGISQFESGGGTVSIQAKDNAKPGHVEIDLKTANSSEVIASGQFKWDKSGKSAPREASHLKSELERALPQEKSRPQILRQMALIKHQAENLEESLPVAKGQAEAADNPFNLEIEKLKKEKQTSEIADQIDKLERVKQEPVKDIENGLENLSDQYMWKDRQLIEGKFDQDMDKIDKLPQASREKIYSALERIANDRGGTPNHLTSDDRAELVFSLAHQIAHPESIRQGTRATCALATSETLTATTDPDKYAQAVADLATTGSAHLANGDVLTIAPDTIRLLTDQDSPARSLSSKIFQTASAQKTLDDYAKREGIDPDKYTLGKDREYLVTADGSSEDPWRGPKMDEQAGLDSALTGADYVIKPLLKGRDLSRPEDLKAVEAEFLKLAERSGLPITVFVEPKAFDFTGMIQDSNSDANQSMQVGHSLLITKIVPGEKPAVYYNNTTVGTDHSYPTGTPVDLSDLLRLMYPADASDDARIIARK